MPVCTCIIQYNTTRSPASNSNYAMAPIATQITEAQLVSHESSSLNGIETYSAVAMMLLATSILPGLVYALVAVWDLVFNTRGDEDEIFPSERNSRRPMSADRFDEYVVHHRPDLLFIDAVAIQGSNFDEKSLRRSRSKPLSDFGSLPHTNQLAETVLLVGGMATDYGIMDQCLAN